MRALARNAVAVRDEAANGIPGRIYNAYTDRGSEVKVWRAEPARDAVYERFFCHGLTFGTYLAFNYTVMSGEANTVLTDEYTEVTRPDGTGKQFSIARPAEEAADLTAFLGRASVGGAVAWLDVLRRVVHTARITAFTAGGARTAGNTTLTTKNGTLPTIEASLADVCHTYRDEALYFEFWDKVMPAQCCVIL